jgi:transposase-like protein
VRKKAVYVAIGVTLEGTRDRLGLWIEKTEGARFWTSVLTELRNRGVKDVLFVCTDGLTGFPEAIDAVFLLSINQICIVHLVRQSLRYLSWKERKSCAGELRRIYTAADADTARAVLEELTHDWRDSKTARPRCRFGSEPGTGSSLSSPSLTRFAASSTPPTPSRACTCRSARRSRPAATSPTTTPRSD